MKTLTLEIILQWPNYFHNFVLYKLFEFWSLEVGCSYKGKVHILHVSSNMNSTTVSEELFSALQTELTKEEVKSGHPGNWLIKSCFLSVYFDRDPLKSI